MGAPENRVFLPRGQGMPFPKMNPDSFISWGGGEEGLSLNAILLGGFYLAKEKSDSCLKEGFV